MSQGNDLRGVRYALSLPSERSARRRALDERLLVRFPVLYPLLARRLMRLPVRSRLRRLWLTRISGRALAGANRRDFEVLLLGMDPEIEFHGAADQLPPDMDPVAHGHDGYEQVWRGMMDAFEDFHGEPVELIDLGDKLLATVQYKGHGSGSDIPVTIGSFSCSGSSEVW